MKKTQKILCYILGAILSVGIIAVMVYQTRDSFVKIWQGVSTRYLFLSLLSSVLIYVSMGMSLYEVLRIMGRRVSKGAAVCAAGAFAKPPARAVWNVRNRQYCNYRFAVFCAGRDYFARICFDVL